MTNSGKPVVLKELPFPLPALSGSGMSTALNQLTIKVQNQRYGAAPASTPDPDDKETAYVLIYVEKSGLSDKYADGAVAVEALAYQGLRDPHYTVEHSGGPVVQHDFYPAVHDTYGNLEFMRIKGSLPQRGRSLIDVEPPVDSLEEAVGAYKRNLEANLMVKRGNNNCCNMKPKI
ncbi:MAG: hypothetical protein PHW76_10100 [Alphaproteobacteria bacterium]|nr:hypothetical protein [Alphaproteobacteria bacterium]